MIFVDTSADDQDHAAAWAWYTANAKPLITTDYVIDELLTLLRSRDEFRRAIEVGRDIIDGPEVTRERISASDFDEAWRIFQDFGDKAWSFTDCTSRVVMARLGIAQAFAFDEHFRQFGTVTVVP